MAVKKYKIFDSAGEKEISQLAESVVNEIADCNYCKLEPMTDDKQNITGYKLVSGALEYDLINPDGSIECKMPLIKALDPKKYDTVFDGDVFKGFKIIDTPKPLKEKFKHTVKFNIVQFIDVVTDSPDKNAAIEAAFDVLREKHFDTKRHARHDGSVKL